MSLIPVDPINHRVAACEEPEEVDEIDEEEAGDMGDALVRGAERSRGRELTRAGMLMSPLGGVIEGVTIAVKRTTGKSQPRAPRPSRSDGRVDYYPKLNNA